MTFPESLPKLHVPVNMPPPHVPVIEPLPDAEPAQLSEIEIEPSSLSQQLGVLRRSGIVVSIREGSTVSYALAGGDVAELLRAARRILTELLAGQSVLLAELQQADLGGPVPERGDGPAPRTVAQAGAK